MDWTGTFKGDTTKFLQVNLNLCIQLKLNELAIAVNRNLSKIKNKKYIEHLRNY